jgi:hypothetical protein
VESGSLFGAVNSDVLLKRQKPHFDNDHRTGKSACSLAALIEHPAAVYRKREHATGFMTRPLSLL